MSEYYGIVKGNRGEATRCGHKTGGIEATAKSWRSRVTVAYWWHPGHRETWVTVTAVGTDGCAHTLFRGPETALSEVPGSVYP
jgi:hypothetical protein